LLRKENLSRLRRLKRRIEIRLGKTNEPYQESTTGTMSRTAEREVQKEKGPKTSAETTTESYSEVKTGENCVTGHLEGASEVDGSMQYNLTRGSSLWSKTSA
jgi:hypothetical protein